MLNNFSQDILLKKFWDYESFFKANSYHGPTDCESICSYIIGDIPVIISARHSIKHVRRNTSLKDEDIYTGGIVRLLNEITECSIIYSSKFESDFLVAYTAYMNSLMTLTKDCTKLVLDIHGAKENDKFDIDVGTNHGKSISTSDYSRICGIFQSHGITGITKDLCFPASSKYSVVSIAQKLSIPAVQLEISKKYRRPHANANEFFSLINSFVEIINTFK